MECTERKASKKPTETRRASRLKRRRGRFFGNSPPGGALFCGSRACKPDITPAQTVAEEGDGAVKTWAEYANGDPRVTLSPDTGVPPQRRQPPIRINGITKNCGSNSRCRVVDPAAGARGPRRPSKTPATAASTGAYLPETPTWALGWVLAYQVKLQR